MSLYYFTVIGHWNASQNLLNTSTFCIRLSESHVRLSSQNLFCNFFVFLQPMSLTTPLLPRKSPSSYVKCALQTVKTLEVRGSSPIAILKCLVSQTFLFFFCAASVPFY